MSKHRSHHVVSTRITPAAHVPAKKEATKHRTILSVVLMGKEVFALAVYELLAKDALSFVEHVGPVMVVGFVATLIGANRFLVGID